MTGKIPLIIIVPFWMEKCEWYSGSLATADLSNQSEDQIFHIKIRRQWCQLVSHSSFLPVRGRRVRAAAGKVSFRALPPSHGKQLKAGRMHRDLRLG